MGFIEANAKMEQNILQIHIEIGTTISSAIVIHSRLHEIQGLALYMQSNT